MQKTYIRNLETGKIQLEGMDKQEYLSLPKNQKDELKRFFTFSRYVGKWVSKSKNNTYMAETIAEKLGFTAGGEVGEMLSYEEQIQRKAEKAEHRAERFKQYSSNAANRGRELQKDREKYKGDISFWTQPIISGHSGSQSFAKYRQRIIDRYHKGFEEYRKSEYFAERAEQAQDTANMTKFQDPVYLNNRIEETQAAIRKLEKTITQIEQNDSEQKEQQLNKYLSKLEWHIDKLAYLQNCIDEVGGNQYNKENIKKGYLVKIRRTWYKVLKANPKTVYAEVIEGGATGMKLKYPYAEIKEVKIPEGYTEEKQETKNPFQVGDIVYYTAIGGNRVIRAFQVVKTTKKTVTIQRIDVQENKPVKDKFISDKTERKQIKEDRQGNIVLNYDNWYLYRYAS